MSKMTRILVAGAMLASFAGVASAYDSSVANRSQRNLADVISIVNLKADFICCELRGTSTAVGNNFNASTQGTTWFENSPQLNLAERTEAQMNVNVGGVAGNVDLASTAICNNASLRTKDGHVHLGNDQRCGGYDPVATIDATFGGVGGNVALNATAIGNNLSSVSTGPSVTASNFNQVTYAATTARIDASLGSVGGAVKVDAAAIGNNVSITQGF